MRCIICLPAAHSFTPLTNSCHSRHSLLCAWPLPPSHSQSPARQATRTASTSWRPPTTSPTQTPLTAAWPRTRWAGRAGRAGGWGGAGWGGWCPGGLPPALAVPGCCSASVRPAAFCRSPAGPGWQRCAACSAAWGRKRGAGCMRRLVGSMGLGASLPSLFSRQGAALCLKTCTVPRLPAAAGSQGIRFVFQDGSRIIFRLSGTGSAGATIR